MHMESVKAKTKIYLLAITIIMSIIEIAFLGVGRSKPVAKASSSMTAVQKLDALEKVAPESSDMAKFLKNEKAAQEANQEAAVLRQ